MSGLSMFEGKTFFEVYHILINEGLGRYTSAGDYRLGLDFGTSFTKTAYSMQGDTGRISYNLEKEAKSSVVYLDTNKLTLHLFKTSENLAQVHYFKATMVKNEKYNILREKDILKKIQDKDLRENFEFLCSVFFIANIINYSSLFVSKKYSKVAIPAVSMGIPMSWNNENTTIYNQALHSALHILDKSFGQDITKMPLADIDNAVREASVTFDNSNYNPKKDTSRNMTIPEVVTEVNYLLDKNDIPFGTYCIIDVGGGTADFAFITKEKLVLHAKKPFFFCHYACVRELGDQIRKKKKKDGKEFKYEADFTSTLGECCCKGKAIIGKKGTPINVGVYLLGGGVQMDEGYYTDIITSKNNVKQLDLSQIGVEVLRPEDEQDARFIIAEQLARSDKKLKQLSGIPIKQK